MRSFAHCPGGAGPCTNDEKEFARPVAPATAVFSTTACPGVSISEAGMRSVCLNCEKEWGNWEQSKSRRAKELERILEEILADRGRHFPYHRRILKRD